MGGVNSQAAVSKTAESFLIEDEHVSIKIGACSMQGWRNYQEDRFSVHIYHHPVLCGPPTFTLVVSLFDGHGGQKTADACKRLWGPYLLSRLHPELQDADPQSEPSVCAVRLTEEVVRSTFLAFDEQVLRSKTHFGSGATATVLVVDSAEGQCVVAHLGDSRAMVFCPTRDPLHVTNDHNPDDTHERTRIERAGLEIKQGRVLYKNVSSLNLCRAFGDKNFKANADLPQAEQAVTAAPDYWSCKYRWRGCSSECECESALGVGVLGEVRCGSCLCSHFDTHTQPPKRRTSPTLGMGVSPTPVDAVLPVSACTVSHRVEGGAVLVDIALDARCTCLCHATPAPTQETEGSSTPVLGAMETSSEADLARLSKTRSIIWEGDERVQTHTHTHTQPPHTPRVELSVAEPGGASVLGAMDAGDLVVFMATDGIWNAQFPHNSFPAHVPNNINAHVHHFIQGRGLSAAFSEHCVALHRHYEALLHTHAHLLVPPPPTAAPSTSGIPKMLLDRVETASLSADESVSNAEWHNQSQTAIQTCLHPPGNDTDTPATRLAQILARGNYCDTTPKKNEVSALWDLLASAPAPPLPLALSAFTPVDLIEKLPANVHTYNPAQVPGVAVWRCAQNAERAHKTSSHPANQTLDALTEKPELGACLSLTLALSLLLELLVAKHSKCAKGSTDNMTALTVVISRRTHTHTGAQGVADLSPSHAQTPSNKRGRISTLTATPVTQVDDTQQERKKKKTQGE